MADEKVRPSELSPRASPVATEVVPSDNGVTVAGVTWAAGVNAGRPLANQAEAEAGSNATKAMTPLTVKQHVTARIGVDLASKAQGDKADTAVQPNELATVATTGDYDDLLNKPTLGTAAATDAGDYATAAQAVPGGGTTGQVLAKASGADNDVAWSNAGAGDLLAVNNLSDVADADTARGNLKAVSNEGDTITGRVTLNSTSDGLVLSRLTSTQRDAIASPVKGLVIYNTDEDDLQVYNGSAWLPVLSVGSGQTWHDVTSSRSAATNYTNNTGRPMFVSVVLASATGSNVMELVVDNDLVQSVTTTGQRGNIASPIPSGATYRVNLTGSAAQIRDWWELY